MLIDGAQHRFRVESRPEHVPLWLNKIESTDVLKNLLLMHLSGEEECAYDSRDPAHFVRSRRCPKADVANT